jgi:hypothetical protein
VASEPLFVNVPASRLLRMPAALLLELANLFLKDEDVQKLARTCSSMPPLLRSYRVKRSVSLPFAVHSRLALTVQQLAALPAPMRLLLTGPLSQAGVENTDQWLANVRFGVVSTVFIDEQTSKDNRLAERLQRLPLSVRHVRVRQEAVGCDSAQSKLAAVASLLPAHVQSLSFEDSAEVDSEESDSSSEDEENEPEERCQPKLVPPPIEQCTLPAGLTALQLPRHLKLDEDGQGAAVQLPPQLEELRLGFELNHSLAKLKLPGSLRVLHFGAAWTQPVSGWPQVPDGLEELVLPHLYSHPLSSLKLPASLRKLHFLPLDPITPSPPHSSHLLDNATAGMFPPKLESLHLPCSAVRERWVIAVASIDDPLDLSLLPPSLRFLRLSDEQPLCCAGDTMASVLQQLRIETLELERGSVERERVRIQLHYGFAPRYVTDEKRFDGLEDCRAELQRRLLKTIQADEGESTQPGKRRRLPHPHLDTR